jgi:hypothetical protein
MVSRVRIKYQVLGIFYQARAGHFGLRADDAPSDQDCSTKSRATV